MLISLDTLGLYVLRPLCKTQKQLSMSPRRTHLNSPSISALVNLKSKAQVPNTKAPQTPKYPGPPRAPHHREQTVYDLDQKSPGSTTPGFSGKPPRSPLKLPNVFLPLHVGTVLEVLINRGKQVFVFRGRCFQMQSSCQSCQGAVRIRFGKSGISREMTCSKTSPAFWFNVGVCSLESNNLLCMFIKVFLLQQSCRFISFIAMSNKDPVLSSYHVGFRPWRAWSVGFDL